MKIGIDLRVLSRGVRTGVEEYVLNLLEALFLIDQSNYYKLFYNAWHKVPLDFFWSSKPNVKLYNFAIPNRLFFFTHRYLGWPKIDLLVKGLDVYFNPHFFNAAVSKKCHKVMTIHDLSFVHFPEFYSWRKRLWQKLLMNVKKESQEAEKIIAVSESTKQDLIELYQINPDKISVIYSGVSKKFKPASALAVNEKHKNLFEQIRLKYRLPQKYILYFGTIEPRKNLTGLIKVFEKIRQNFEIKLVVAGTRGWLYEEIFKTAKQSPYKQDIVFTGFIEEQDKPVLYNLAELFVYPSFFEGFGFPPLEAMACGIPSIVSHNSSLPEIVGKGALMIDPYNLDDLAQAIETGLSNQKVRQYLIQEGLAQAKKFTWQNCAEQTLGLLTSL